MIKITRKVKGAADRVGGAMLMVPWPKESLGEEPTGREHDWWAAPIEARAWLHHALAGWESALFNEVAVAIVTPQGGRRGAFLAVPIVSQRFRNVATNRVPAMVFAEERGPTLRLSRSAAGQWSGVMVGAEGERGRIAGCASAADVVDAAFEAGFRGRVVRTRRAHKSPCVAKE